MDKFKIFNKTFQPIQLLVENKSLILLPNSLNNFIFEEKTPQIIGLLKKEFIKIYKVG